MRICILESPIYDARINLAIEEYICRFWDLSDLLVLYLWVNDRFVIIGKNQNAYLECNLNYIESNGINVVRRLSGGGAVYHDKGNLNYSIISSEKHFSREVNDKLILEAFGKLNIKAYKSGRNDFMLDGYKISGTAYSHQENYFCQHGSILVSADRDVMYHALKVNREKYLSKGIQSAEARTKNLVDYNPMVTVEELKQVLKQTFRNYISDYKEINVQNILVEENYKSLLVKYYSKEWNWGLIREYKVNLFDRFEWGDCSILLDIADSCISKCKIYTDSLETTTFDKIETCLLGVTFDSESLISALNCVNDICTDSILKDIKNFLIKNIRQCEGE